MSQIEKGDVVVLTEDLKQSFGRFGGTIPTTGTVKKFWYEGSKLIAVVKWQEGWESFIDIRYIVKVEGV